MAAGRVGAYRPRANDNQSSILSHSRKKDSTEYTNYKQNALYLHDLRQVK